MRLLLRTLMGFDKLLLLLVTVLLFLQHGAFADDSHEPRQLDDADDAALEAEAKADEEEKAAVANENKAFEAQETAEMEEIKKIVISEGCSKDASGCSGHGTCTSQGLCICDNFWAGNECEEQLEDVTFEEGGMNSGSFGMTVLIGMAMVPCTMFAMSRCLIAVRGKEMCGLQF